MKKFIAIAVCCACWAVESSSPFVVTSGAASTPKRLPFAGHDRHLARCRSRRRGSSACRRRPFEAMMVGTQHEISRAWLRKVVPTAVAVSVLIGASVAAPVEAAAKVPKQGPVVEALVQLPDEEADWTKLLSDVNQAAGANMLITASKDKGGKPSLGASIAMDKLRFPVMMQLFPKNAVGGAVWPGDFEQQGTYAVEVVVCGAGQTKGGVCESPLPIVGSGESVFVTGLEDVPEIAESGGMRVPATIILTPPSERVLAPP